MKSRTRRARACMVLAVGIITSTLFFLTPGEEPRAEAAPPASPPIYITHLWHMHQPIYYPYESVTNTVQRGAYSFDIHKTHSDRGGAYSTWPVDAVRSAMGSNLPHAGAQVSFSGSLMENLDAFESAGWSFQGWKNAWRESNHWKTARGNPRLDLVGFAYHHPLLPLLDDEVARRQIGKHKAAYAAAWNGPGVPHRPYSKGFFPPENAFAPWMIPALKAEGVEWALVDNIHMQRACQGYPWTPNGGLIPPNKADQQNADPRDWTQLRDLWAPTKVSAGWSFRPHWVRHVDPATGQAAKIIAVPTARYMGNEDGRGGFGALQYERVMQQIQHANTDPNHPVLIVLHHDGDDHGGGADSYYHANWGRFLSWAQANGQRFVPTTIQDYVDMFPPAQDDVIHVEPGSWSGADNGDAEFKKWLADPNQTTGYSPDINSWAVMVAAANRVKTAGSVDPRNPDQGQAWRMLLNGYASDYWYWDGTEIWDSNPTRAANGAFHHADRIISLRGVSNEQVPPQVFLPQREPYNPGEKEFGNRVQPKDFQVWTLAYDVSGLRRVTLKVRVDADGTNAKQNDQNETYAGGSDVGAWREIPMRASNLPASQTNPAPRHRAQRYVADVRGHSGQLLDYYVEAEDQSGNVSKTPILHVWVGGAAAGVSFTPASPTADQRVTIKTRRPGKLHWAVNGWQLPDVMLRPSGSVGFTSAVQTPLAGPDAQGQYSITIGPFLTGAGSPQVTKLDFVIRYDDGTWDNNTGRNYQVPVAPMPIRVSPAQPAWNEQVVIRSGSPGIVRWGINGWQSPSAALRPPGTVVAAGGLETPLVQSPLGDYVLTLGPFAGALDVQRVDFVIRRPNGTWDNNGNRDYRIDLKPKQVWWSPLRLGSGGGSLTIYSKTPGTLHYGVDGWTGVQDVALLATGPVFTATPQVPAAARTVDFAIRRNDGTWDNNSGRDFHVRR